MTATKTAQRSKSTTSQAKILLVDDDPIILDSLGEFLLLEGYSVSSAGDFHQAMDLLGTGQFELMITDINMPGVNGMELLTLARQKYPQTVVIMITGYGTIESAVEAIKVGAYDYLTKPIIDDEIRITVERALQQQSLIRENQLLRQQLADRHGMGNIIGQDHKMIKVFELVDAVAQSKTNILISGPSGTGKSMVARAIHQHSSRCSGPFVEISCGALPETLLESELFGHVRGAFTGAVSDKPGKFLAADGGTIFLDEITSAGPALQVKLLRVLQERQFEPVGSNKTVNVDVRVILACNEDLAQQVKAGKFREDLYYRINVVNIPLPRLSQRIGDIPLLARHFLEKFRKQNARHITDITPEAMNYLQRHSWGGNVRELENVIERAVVLSKDQQIDVDDLPAELLDGVQNCPQDLDLTQPVSLKQALEGPEQRIIQQALKASGGNRQMAAKILQINRTTLYKKMKRYGLDAQEF